MSWTALLYTQNASGTETRLEKYVQHIHPRSVCPFLYDFFYNSLEMKVLLDELRYTEGTIMTMHSKNNTRLGNIGLHNSVFPWCRTTNYDKGRFVIEMTNAMVNSS